MITRDTGEGGRETGLADNVPGAGRFPRSRLRDACGLRVRPQWATPAAPFPSLSLGLLGTTQPEGPTELAAGTALHPTRVLSGPLLPKFTERGKHICRPRATGSGLCGA